MWEKPFQRSCLATLVEVDDRNDSSKLYGLNSIRQSHAMPTQNQHKNPIRRKLFSQINNPVDAANRLFIRSHSKVKLAPNWQTIQFSPSPLRRVKCGRKRTRQAANQQSKQSYLADPYEQLSAAVKKHQQFFNRKISKLL